MEVNVHIATEDDAAVQNPEFEATAALRIIADRIGNGDREGLVRDSNGNSIGTWEMWG